MKYVSTRGQTEPMGFQDAVLTGLAPDGGLLVPEEIPAVGDRLADWSRLSYQDLTHEVLRLFVDIPEPALRELIERSYAAFSHPEIAPAWPVGPVHILELFHGPTLAFKDVALQFLSNFFQYTLDQRNLYLNVLGATSGDTGSAAIHGVRGRERIAIFMMHPRGRVALLQEKQMTSVLDSNVFNLAVEGTFDDCQQLMKATFRDLAFKERYALGAVNSVNWARVLAQIVYYFSAGLYVMGRTGSETVSFSVPTGNFGDILAGYYAWRMGLPLRQLVLATNENDILHRFFATGAYRPAQVVKTLSPSMDIQVASNFERYLFDRVGRDSARLQSLMDSFTATSQLELPEVGQDPEVFVSGVGDRGQTLDTIRRYHRDHDYLLDPHTAVGVSVGEQFRREGEPMICLATAHPAKFNDAITEAIGEPARHPALERLRDAPSRCEVMANGLAELKAYIAGHALTSA